MSETPEPYAALPAPPAPPAIPPEVAAVILEYLRDGRWGTIELVVKAGRIIAVKRIETLHLDARCA